LKVVGTMSIYSNQQSVASDVGLAAGQQERAKTFTIGDLSREFGVTLRTLRFYEDKGLLTPRREGTTRVYGLRERETMRIICQAKRMGFTLTEIRAMVAQDRTSEAPAASLKLSLSQVEEQIAHLEQQRAEIEEALVELKAHRATLSAAA
jgi:DNA-binding transcriptional MerR regulator